MNARSSTRLMVTGLVCGILCAGESAAKIVPVGFDLWPAYQANELKITSAAAIEWLGMTLADAESSSWWPVSGYVTADLEIEFDPRMPRIVDIRAIDFTGGFVRFEDAVVELDLSLMGSIEVVLDSVAGTVETMSSVAAVHNGLFDASEHALLADTGYILVWGTGIVDALYMEPIVADLSDEALELAGVGTGRIAATLSRLNQDWATYELTFSLPIEGDIVSYDGGSICMNTAAAGTIVGTGYFTWAVPEPATVALLALGTLALRGRSRARR